MRVCLLTLLLLSLATPPVFGWSGQAQRSPPVVVGPTTIEADEIAYDSVTGMATASGNVRLTNPRFRLFATSAVFDARAQTVRAEGSVRLIDASGREIRADRIVYDIEAEKAVAFNAESLVGFTYIRADQIEAEEGLITGTNATVTTCDPAGPIYRVTAQHVTLVPGIEMVARHASVWLGGWRVITLPVYRMSLRPGEAGPELPKFGYNRDDGWWISYRRGIGLASLDGSLYLKYGQKTGAFVSTALTRPGSPWTLSLGRDQTQDAQTGAFRSFTHAELGLGHAQRLGGLPFNLSTRVGAGWFQETAVNVSTSRFDAILQATSDNFLLSPRLRFNGSASFRISAYGIGDQRQILGGALELVYQVTPVTTAAATYGLQDVRGRTPFSFDSVTPTSIVALAVHYRPADFQVSAGLSHDTAVPKTLASFGVGARISPTFFVAAATAYNLTGRFIEDLDYSVEYRCDCLTVSLRYRQIRQELWLEVSLRGVSEQLRLQFQR